MRLGDILDKDFQPTEFMGRENLPKIGERCIFILRSWDDRPVQNFRCFGYRDDVNTIYIPLYKKSLHKLCLKSWFRIGGEDFANGHF